MPIKNKPEQEPDLSPLTGDQLVLLASAIEMVTQKVQKEVITRLNRYTWVGLVALTCFGAWSVLGFRSSIKDAVVASLREDAALRSSIKDELKKHMDEAQSLADKVKEMEADLEREKTDANIVLKQSLHDLRLLTETLVDRHASIKKETANGAKD